jgi:signal transduction histidine kinase
VGNAIKFTNAGGTIELGLSDEGKDIRIAVADTGLGIAEDQISKLFQPFSQLRGVNYRPGEGSGLGLSICKQIVQAHGGRIGLESEPGKGSTFSVFLPKAGPTDTIDQSISLSEGI